jgi:hypothetical protein
MKIGSGFLSFDEEMFGSKEEVATGLMKLHEKLCGTCQIRWEQNKFRQGSGWETVKESCVKDVRIGREIVIAKSFDLGSWLTMGTSIGSCAHCIL